MTLTENLIDGSGSNTYNFTFPILDQEDVRVQLREFDPNLPPEDQIVSQISTTAFDVFSSPNRVIFQPIANETIYQDANGNVKVTSDNGYQVVIRIYRDTDIDSTAAYFYPGSAIRAEDLNENFKQLIFAAQETDAELEDILAGIFPDESIPGTALKDGAVTTDKIADGAVTPEKLDREYVQKTGDNMTGDLTLGTNPASPNITLDTDGTIVAAADATINGLTIGLGGGSLSTNTAIGVSTLLANTSGNSNVALGRTALRNNISGGSNTAVGWSALLNNTTGLSNTSLGREALKGNIDGGANTALGLRAHYNNTTGSYNTTVGMDAGYFIEGSNNTVLGAYRGTAADATLSNTVIISAGTTERMRIDSDGDVGIGTTNPQAKLDINGKAQSTSTVAGDSGTTLVTKDYVDSIPPGGVTKIVAGDNVTISPTGGTGVVTVNSTGGGGGTGTPTNTNIYGTAKAAGSVSAAGVKISGFGFTSSLSGQGNYNIVFDTPRSDANYSVTGLSHWNPSGFETNLNIGSKSSTGFTVIFFQENVVNSSTPGTFDFAVHDEEQTEVSLTTTGDVINYSGASAWASVSPTGILLDGLNASVSRTSLGTYQITFNTPMPNGNYSITFGAGTTLVRNSTNKTASGFDVQTYTDVGVLGDVQFNFAVFATNALPPKGGTGTDAWGAYNYGLGVLTSSFNCTAVKNGVGDFTITFNTPMPTADYSVTTSIASPINVAIRVINKTSNGFQVQTGNNGETFSNFVDAFVDFQVNATNATLPLTYTTEQIDSAINNPGCSAWGSVLADGTLNNGLNIASVTRVVQGIYDVVFTTPMPTNTYAVTGSSNYPVSGTYWSFSANTKTTAGFRAYVCRSDPSSGAILAQDSDFSFNIFATNALPPTGGTGTDAWAKVNGAGAFHASYNFSSVVRTGVGTYYLAFVTPMPSGEYAVLTGCDSSHTQINANNQSAAGFAVEVADAQAGATVDANFFVSVNATNATLPASLTRDMIVMKAGDTMTGELIVPSLSSPSGNLPIQRASVADSEVQSFKVQDDVTQNWYPFNPIPTWCNHVRYNISVVLSVNAITNGGLYLRWGSATGQILGTDVSASGLNSSVLENGPGIIYYSDPLVLKGSPSNVTYYDYVMDFYFYNRGFSGGNDFFCYGIGSGAMTHSPPISANVSNARMIVQHIIPQAPPTAQPDRMGLLFFGGTAAGGQNLATVKQTFLTDGPVGFAADLGPTPTPI